MSQDNPNHVYYSNRANVYNLLNKYQNAIEDCDTAIKIDPKFVKSYFRKAKAQHMLRNFKGALESAKLGLDLEPDNKEMKEM